MFSTTCATSASLSKPTRVGDRHTMPARSPSTGIPSKATGLQATMFATLKVSPAGHLGPNSYHSSLKGTQVLTKVYLERWAPKGSTSAHMEGPLPCNTFYPHSQGTRTWLLDSLLTSQAMEKNRRGHSIHLWAPGRSQISVQNYQWVPF